MILTIWSDFACPFCWIGEANLEKALEKKGIEDAVVNYMAFELAPDFPADKNESALEHMMAKFGISEETAQARLRKITSMAAEAGLEFHLDKTRYCNTFDAHRLVKYAAAHDAAKVHALVEALFRAFFSEGKLLSDRDTLADIAASAGYDRDDARKMLDTDRFADDVRENERIAHLQGIHSVPYIVVNDRLAIPGALPVEDFVKALGQAEEMSGTAPADRSSDGTAPRRCDGESCEL